MAATNETFFNLIGKLGRLFDSIARQEIGKIGPINETRFSAKALSDACTLLRLPTRCYAATLEPTSQSWSAVGPWHYTRPTERSTARARGAVPAVSLEQVSVEG